MTIRGGRESKGFPKFIMNAVEALFRNVRFTIFARWSAGPKRPTCKLFRRGARAADRDPRRHGVTHHRPASGEMRRTDENTGTWAGTALRGCNNAVPEGRPIRYPSVTEQAARALRPVLPERLS